jgi:predicted site-specific integrase-resolvase
MVGMDGRVKLSVAAKILGISRSQAKTQAYNGSLPTIISSTGRRFVPVSWLKTQTGEAPHAGSRCAIYSRESSSENKTALASQTDGLRRYAQAKGWTLVYVVEEYGSGVNDQRKKLHKLLSRRDFDVLLVEHKDRLTRFGFAWFEAICPFQIEVVNRAEDKVTDLMEDLVAILTSFSARLYGQRRGRKKTEAAIKALEAVK